MLVFFDESVYVFATIVRFFSFLRKSENSSLVILPPLGLDFLLFETKKTSFFKDALGGFPTTGRIVAKFQNSGKGEFVKDLKIKSSPRRVLFRRLGDGC